MRRLVYFSLVMFAMLAVSCANKTKQVECVAADTFSIDDIDELETFVEDEAESIPFIYEKCSVSEKFGVCNYATEVDYPTGGSPELLETIRGWITAVLVPQSLNSTYKRFVPSRDGSWDDGNAVLNFYAKDYERVENEMAGEDDLAEGVETEFTTKITVEHESNNLITYNFNRYEYAGGAHGGTYAMGATFFKDSGKKVSWDVLSSKNAIRPEIVTGLKKYFEVRTNAELEETLMLPENATLANIPLPDTEPWLTADGLCLVYQQYEIASYAAGMPCVVIPFSNLEKYLKPEYRQLISGE